MPKLRLFLPTLFTWLSGQAFADVVNLANLNWTLSNANGTINIPSTGPPTQVHIDLSNAGLITEPLLGINGICDAVSWYGIYWRHLSIPSERHFQKLNENHPCLLRY